MCVCVRGGKGRKIKGRGMVRGYTKQGWNTVKKRRGKRIELTKKWRKRTTKLSFLGRGGW